MKWSAAVVALLSGLVGALCRLGHTQEATECVRACASIVPDEVKKVLWNRILETTEVTDEPN